MTLFEEIVNKYEVQEQVEQVNDLIKKTNAPYKNSKRFVKDTGLGTVFCMIEKHFNKKGYEFNDAKSMFIKTEEIKADKEIINVDAMILNYIKDEGKGKIRKGSFQMYEGAEKELKALYEKYPYFNKGDLLYVVIMEGIKNLK